MRVASDYQLARALASRSEPFFYTRFADKLIDEAEVDGGVQLIIGRRYPGLFNGHDGSFASITTARNGDTLIDRDSYGAIPLFYSTTSAIVSTDIRLLIDIEQPDLDFRALAEYVSASYLTGGKTIFQGIRFLMPNETIAVRGQTVSTSPKPIFPEAASMTAQDVARLLEDAIDRSIDDLLRRFPGAIVINLSGGADSTLLLAKIRERDPNKEIWSTTYFHADWRDDLNDWEYAEQAATKYGSRHRLVKIDNEAFCRAHQQLMHGAANVFHTYAAAFYAQNQVVADLPPQVPIINGSGPDESIIGTEKMPIAELLALRDLKREEWIDYLIANIDYAKIPESLVTKMLLGSGDGFTRGRKAIAGSLAAAPDFVEFQRRYHAITVLQDHLQELSAVAQTLARPILFPYLTDDIFRIIFSARFETLNAGAVYKQVVKSILEKYMPKEFVYRKKIGFQSPSRPYFKSKVGLGRELERLLSKRSSDILRLELVEPDIRARLDAEVDLQRRYDFLEWTAYNILLLEESRG